MKELGNPQKCQVSGNKLNYFREGQGETVLLVHGITTYSFIWAEIFHLLKPDFDVIAVDLPGCGDSDKSVEVDITSTFIISISKLVIIPDAGHLIQLDEPEKLAQILQQFIKEKSYAA